MGREKPARGEFGECLRAIRQQHGWSQETLCRRAGLSRAHVSLIERGYRHPAPATVSRIGAALNLDAASMETLQRVAAQARNDTTKHQIMQDENARRRRQWLRQKLRGKPPRAAKLGEASMQIHVTVPVSLARQIETLAALNGVSSSALARLILATHLDVRP